MRIRRRRCFCWVMENRTTKVIRILKTRSIRKNLQKKDASCIFVFVFQLLFESPVCSVLSLWIFSIFFLVKHKKRTDKGRTLRANKKNASVMKNRPVVWHQAGTWRGVAARVLLLLVPLLKSLCRFNPKWRHSNQWVQHRLGRAEQDDDVNEA